MQFKKITIITGEYGSGKTNLSVNLAYAMKEKGSAAIIDLDTVNPYFRTADFREELKEAGIDVITPEFANTNLDIPVLNFDIESVIRSHDCTVIDVGGSDAGAYALGRYKAIIEKYNGNYDMFYVYNMYRFVDETPEDAVVLLREIEQACRLKCTGIVSNPNLGYETTKETVDSASDYTEKVSSLSGLPVAFRCVPETVSPEENDFSVQRKVKLIWE